MKKLKPEFREHPKVNVFVSSKKLPAFQGHNAYTHALRVEGVLLEISPPLKTDCGLEKGFTIPLNFLLSSNSGPISLQGEITWIKTEALDADGAQISCMGVKFLGLQQRAKDAIESFRNNKEGAGKVKEEPGKLTCRSCKHFSKADRDSRYANCDLHGMTIRDSDDEISMTFSQIYSQPCGDHTPK